jgi:hypothetical protein
MSHPNNNDADATNTSGDENINNSVHSFLHNITSSIYNNTFLDAGDSNTILNEAFLTDILQTPPPPNIEPPPPPASLHTDSNISAVGILPFNYPNIGGSAGNRFLLRQTRISFRDILPNGTYGGSRYVNIIPSASEYRNTNSVLNSVIQHSFNEDGTVFKQVISDKGKNMLKTVPYSALDTEETKCTIMQEQFEDNTVVIELPCKHVFCEEPIIHWLENESASCPVCRTKLPSKEIRINKNRNDTNESANNDIPVNNVRINHTNRDNEENEDNGQRARSFSAPTLLNNNDSEYYRSIINNITRIRDLTEEEDTQRAIWNSIATSSS